MSDSYAVLPVTLEVRSWLESEGLAPPTDDGKEISLQELKRAVATFPEIHAEWSEGPEFYDGVVSSKSGMKTVIIVGNPGGASAPCEFHFRGGDCELIEIIVGGIASFAGPQVIYAHSGSFIKVVQ